MKIALGAARGLAYLQEDSNPRVIHRDFKASNVLLEDYFTPKVSDFGLAREATEGSQHISTRVMGTFGNIAQVTKVKIMRKQGQWEDLNIPRSIGSIVCLNLPSFSGGFNPWGKPYRKKFHDVCPDLSLPLSSRGLTTPFVDDGLIEIVGFKNALHGLVLLAPHGHGTRLAQVEGKCRFEFKKGAANHTFMRIDGEPWKQPLPVDDDTVVVEISHFGQVSMLATPFCRSQSVNNPSSAISRNDEDKDSTDEGESPDGWEEKRKFGAADTFKIPDKFDITQLS
ncbi:hypothetical protein REPUB_Repub11eG0025400 [Reevesia pubescens]